MLDSPLVKWFLYGTFPLLTGPSLATDIAWRSQIGGVSEDSFGNPLDANWSFYLGYFSSGFTPSSSDSDLWAANWITVDVSAYGGAIPRFVGSWENDGSVPVGTKGFIWGANRESATPEWIMMSATHWNWPSSNDNPLDPGDDEVTWAVEEADEVIVGEVETAGQHMQTASASGEPPFLTGDHWLLLQFSLVERLDANISGWNADPDGDQQSNLLEFAFGTAPKDNTSFGRLETMVTGGVFEFTVPRARNTGVDFFGQVGSTLQGLQEGAPHVTLENETPSQLTFRDATPMSGGTRFGRVRVSLQP